MTEILELSANSLKIIYTRNRLSRIFNSVLAMMCFGFAAFAFSGGVAPEPDLEHPEFAPIFLFLMGIFLSAFASFVLASVFDATGYSFDRTADKFHLSGRRNLFRKWSVEGAISDITDVSYEISGNDEDYSSEICLKYRCFGSLTETIRCGTGEKSEDENIADCIKRFL